MKPFWIWRSQPAAPYQIGARRITPVVQSIGLRWPNGGWLWQFPLAIDVADEAESEPKRLPIPDTTRTVVWFLAALTVVAAIIMLLTMRRTRRQNRMKRINPKRLNPERIKR